MDALRAYSATIIATLLALVLLVYTVLTPTNVLLGLFQVVLLVGTGLLLDRLLL